MFRADTFSCICCEYSRTILVVFSMYVISLILMLMTYFICIGMNLIECMLSYISITTNLWTISHIILWFLYACVFLSNYVLLQASKVFNHFPFIWENLDELHLTVRRFTHSFPPKLSYTTLCVIASKAHNWKPLHQQPGHIPNGIPTPNNVRSNWDFISGRSTEYWWV